MLVKFTTNTLQPKDICSICLTDEALELRANPETVVERIPLRELPEQPALAKDIQYPATMTRDGADLFPYAEAKLPTPFASHVLLAISGQVVAAVEKVRIKYHEDFGRMAERPVTLTPSGVASIGHVSLHQHSWFSLLDGIVSPKKIAAVSVWAAALTDHGNCYGMFEFYHAMKYAGKKAILGFEAYCESLDGNKRANHLVLLARNNKGAHNIMKLTSLASDNMHRRPQVKWEWLREHGEGVIILTACLGGEIPRALRNGDHNQALKVLKELKAIAGEEYVFLEAQRHGIKEEDVVNEGLIRLSNATNTPIVATTDSHYLKKEDDYIHELQLCMQTGKTYNDPTHYKFNGTGYHIHSDEEMRELFKDHPEWLDNTIKVAQMCSASLETGEYHLPEFPLPAGFKTQDEFFIHQCWSGFEKRFKEREPHKYMSEEYRERLNFEIKTIENMGFSGYFNITQDFMLYAKNNGILIGPGRGSACGSLVAYVLEITDVDPIEYGLLFERFLNPDRISMPDIDCDFDDHRREEVIDYVKGLYGANNVSRIATFGTLAAKAAIRDVARVLDKPLSLADKIAKAIPNTPKIKLQTALEESAELQKLYRQSADAREIFDIALQFEGLPKNTSQHACGVIICGQPVSDHVPQVMLKNPKTGLKEPATQFNMEECEKMGLLKMDFLGLRTLGAISEAIQLVNQRDDVKEPINFYEMSHLEMDLYKTISNGDTSGVFQLESSGMTGLMRELYQDIQGRGTDAGREMFERLVAGLSLYRPGPMDEIPNYVNYMLHPEQITYDIPEMAQYLDNTYSIITYQEQVMFLVRELAGFSKGQADYIRKGMGKKNKEVIDECKEWFLHGSEKENVDGCAKRGIDVHLAEDLWNKMEKFGRYAFNRSHAVGYAVVAARTAWLATYYPVEYMTATLNSYIKNADRIRLYMAVCRQKGIEVLPPQINRSQELFSVEGQNIRFGLRGIKNMGAFSKQLIEVRNTHGEFESVQDLMESMARHANIDSRNLEAMIYSGTLDEFEGTRQAKVEAMEDYLSLGREVKGRVRANQTDIWSLFKPSSTLTNLTRYNLVDREEMDRQFKLEKEYEFAQFYMSEHPIDQYADLLETELTNVEKISYIIDSAMNEDELDFGSLGLQEVDEAFLEAKALTQYKDGDMIEVAGVLKGVEIKYTKKDKKPMAIFEIEDRSGVMRGVCFTEAYDRFIDLLQNGTVVRLKGQLKVDDFGCQVMANSFVNLASLKDRKALQKIELIGAKNIELARHQFKQVRELVRGRYVGQTDVIFLLPDGKGYKPYPLPAGFEVSVASIQAMKEIMGEKGTRFVYAS